MCEFTKKNSPSFSIAYDSAIFTFPALTDLISDPFNTIPASKISWKKKLKDAFLFKQITLCPGSFFIILQ